MKTASFQHYGNVGDVIYSIPSIVDLTRRAGADKAVLHLEIDHPAIYHGQHPLKNVNLSRAYAEKLMPLLKCQPIFADVAIWDGKTVVDYNLNWFRSCPFDHGRGDITKWYRHRFKCLPNSWDAWLRVEPDPDYEGWIIVNRTSRYQNQHIDYSFMKAYASRMIFMGLPAEELAFRRSTSVIVPRYLPRDFLAAARAIAACKCFIGNQSSCFALAEGLKVPRCLETSPVAPNVNPTGAGGYEAVHQEMLESVIADLVK
jgi:hypothetical protein